MKILAITFFIPFAALAANVAVPPLPLSPFLDTEVATNLPLRVGELGRDWHFEFQMSCATASNAVQIAFGEDEDANGVLAPEETRLVVGRDATGAFVEFPARGERFEELMSPSGPRVGFGTRVFLRHAGQPSRLSATNETGRAVFADWWTNPPQDLFEPSWNLLRVTVRGPTSASEHAFVSVGPSGHVLIFR